MTTGGRCYSRAYALQKGKTWCERARAWADVQSRQCETRSMSCAGRPVSLSCAFVICGGRCSQGKDLRLEPPSRVRCSAPSHACAASVVEPATSDRGCAGIKVYQLKMVPPCWKDAISTHRFCSSVRLEHFLLVSRQDDCFFV